MRLSTLVAMLVFHLAAGAASAGTDDTNARVGYIPAPTAKAVGRPTVIARLRELGKEKIREAHLLAEDECPDYHFEAKVLLDTPALFSLKTISYQSCPQRSTEGDMASLLFEMKSGREYDISRLYHVRDAQGGLIAPLRKLVARRIDPKQLGMTHRQVAEAVADDLARGRPHLFVTKTGIWAWPETGLVWLDEIVLTWADLRPYLDVSEAKRIGWSGQ